MDGDHSLFVSNSWREQLSDYLPNLGARGTALWKEERKLPTSGGTVRRLPAGRAGLSGAHESGRRSQTLLVLHPIVATGKRSPWKS